MHEFSIASALVELVAQHVPSGAVLRRVVIEAGPLQGVDLEAMQWAWRGVTQAGPFEASELEIAYLPWQLHCPVCEKDFAADTLEAPCSCGSTTAHPVGGRELRLRSLVIDEATTQEGESASGETGSAGASPSQAGASPMPD